MQIAYAIMVIFVETCVHDATSWEVNLYFNIVIAYNDNAIVVCLPQGSSMSQHIMTDVF